VAGMNALHDITPLIAESGWHHDGLWWFPFGLLWLAVLGGLIWLVVRTIRARGRSATEILAERYARGEVTSEEYRERLAELRTNR
jgi:putative membrane protein